ncbi:hypothetical protein D1970_11855 [Mesobacillus zeae]|uniref:Uncharacterized protein n=1 Tax=Mesobacillus zeae TaxID=1917180 RepID=A0A398BA78_9BACI|nr:hypothetical protein D1970_11855 [Mesobacillus zeae]
MKEKDMNPNKKVFDKLSEELKSIKNIPPGAYRIHLHDNLINRKTGIGSKDNSIDTHFEHLIIKE